MKDNRGYRGLQSRLHRAPQPVVLMLIGALLATLTWLFVVVLIFLIFG